MHQHRSQNTTWPQVRNAIDIVDHILSKASCGEAEAPPGALLALPTEDQMPTIGIPDGLLDSLGRQACGDADCVTTGQPLTVRGGSCEEAANTVAPSLIPVVFKASGKLWKE